MVGRAQQRASGEPGAIEEAKVASEDLTKDIEISDHDGPKWRTPRFMRMRFAWNPDERMVISRAQAASETAVLNAFPDAFGILNSIYEIVREPLIGPGGEVVRDTFGLVQWQQRSDGSYIEDFTKLARREKEHYIGLITTRLFSWEQTQATMWAEAMFAKAQFEERFAISYDAPISGTVDDRRAAANKDAAEERYLAIFLTVVSRRADAIVRSMDRLSQRLKDVLVAG